MTEQTNIRLLALVGMPGAGKTEAVDYVASKGWPKVYFGGIVYDEMKQAGVEITAESQQAFREQLRAQKGKDYIARRAIEEIRKLIAAGQHNIVLDGVYSWSEYKALKHEFHHEFEVIAVVAPKHIRHHRLANRPERPFTEEEATHRDFTEIENIEKGGPIAIADHYVVNTGSLEDLHHKIDDIMQRDTFAE